MKARKKMKKKLLGLAILILCFALSSAAFAENSKIGYADRRKIYSEYEKAKNFNKKLEKEDGEVKSEIEKRSKELRKLYEETELLSDDAKKKKETELRESAEKLEAYRKEKIDGFLKQQNDMFQEIQEDIQSVAEKYAIANGYDVILDEAVFVYSSDTLDVTNAILKELNKK